jgi:signal transduction histidine kinase
MVGADFLDLGDVVGLAATVLRADGLLVVDERPSEPRVVMAEGLTASELAEALDQLGSPGRPGVHAGTLGERRILSTALCLDSGERIGYLYAVYGTDTPLTADLDMLVQAFGRHIGFAVARGAARRRDDPTRTPAPRWKNLERLPESVHGITGIIADFVRPLTGATAVGITVWDEERGILQALPGSFGAKDVALVASVTGPATNMLSTGTRVFTTGQPYLSNHASGDPGILQPYVKMFRISRILSVPLDTGDRRIGVLHLINKPTDFTSDDIAAVESVTPQIAITVDLARLVLQMTARQRLEKVLTGAAVSIASAQPLAQCLVPAFDELAALTGASVVALFPREAPPLIRRIGPPDRELERRLAQDAAELGARSSGAFPHRPGDPGWAALHAPVELSGERTATLSVLRRTGEPFLAAEQDVITRLASLVALAWATERYQHQLAEIARLRERERIADELHDRVAQILFAAQLGIDTVLETTTSDLEAERMVEVRELLIKGDTTIREVIHQLTAGATTASLGRRVRLEVESVEDEFGVAVHVELPTDDELRVVPRPVADALVKLAREGTVNAAKHAGPCRIALEVHLTDDEIVMAIVDDGLGLRSPTGPKSGYGLASLNRQVADMGGTLVVTAGAGGFGTRLAATLPL